MLASESKGTGCVLAAEKEIKSFNVPHAQELEAVLFSLVSPFNLQFAELVHPFVTSKSDCVFALQCIRRC